LEQGSGACLWQTSSSGHQTICDACTNLYNPKESDHDLQLMLRDFVTGVPDNFLSDPHSSNNLQGDWYFRQPANVGGQWQYTRPDGSTLTQPGSLPQATPAQIIAQRLSSTVHLLGYDSPDVDLQMD